MRAASRAGGNGRGAPTSDVPSSRDRVSVGARVLIVEDEDMLGRALVRFLRGYTVIYCRSADEALVRIRAGELFDVIVSDIMMPGGNGSDLYATLLTEAPALAARMFFMTGGATTPETMAFVAAHKADVVMKPLDLANLRRRVEGVVVEHGLLTRPT
jgi:DNA-binding response OmpR family regulator